MNRQLKEAECWYAVSTELDTHGHLCQLLLDDALIALWLAHPEPLSAAD